jgi:hypothetical protein
MASNNQQQRGYANINMPTRNEESKTSSFQDEISTLSSMIQRGAAQKESSSAAQRGADPNHHFDRQRGEILNSQRHQYDLQRGAVPNQQFWGGNNESSPRGHPNHQQWTNQTSFPQPLHPNVNEQSPPIQQFTHHCSICNVSCNHEIAYRQHLTGKKHLKKAGLFAGGETSQNSGVSPTSAIATQSSVQFAAQIPGVFPNTNIMPANGPIGFTPQQLVPTAQPLIGGKTMDEAAHHTIPNHVKQQSNEPNDETHEQYHCSVCDVTCNHELAYRQHLEGKRHRKQVTRFGSNGAVTGNEGVIPPVHHNVTQPAHVATSAAAVILVDPRINPPPPPPPAPTSQQIPTDPRTKPATGATAASSINQQLADPRKQNAQAQKVEALATGSDSEEEGEIDEAEEDIEHLYNDFEEPDSTATVETGQTNEISHGRNDGSADPDIDEMFGEDDVIVDADKTQVDMDMDSDVDKMFGEDDQATPISDKNEVCSSHNQVSDQKDADEEDMFGESDEEGEVNDHSIHNTTCSPEVQERNQRDDDEIDMFGLDDEQDNGNNTKHVSFCINPPVAESKTEPSVPLTPSEALAAARRRASIPKKPEFGVKSLLKKMAPTTQQNPSMKSQSLGLVQKETKPKSLLKKTAPASKIRKTNTTSIAISQQNVSADTPKRSYYQTVHPDKFWSTLRHWDIVRDLNNVMKKGKQDKAKNGKDVSNSGKKRSLDEAINEDSSAKVLPDKFDSVAQYQALWAPLLIEEAKAQLLSEVVSAQSAPATAWMNRSRLVMGVAAKVELSRSARDLSFDDGNGSKKSPIEPTVVLHVRPTTKGAGLGCPVSPNDLLLFVREASVLELGLRGMALKNTDDASSSGILGAGKMSDGRLGFIGHALNHRSRSVDGLLVRASKTLWSHFSFLDELFVIRIGYVTGK